MSLVKRNGYTPVAFSPSPCRLSHAQSTMASADFYISSRPLLNGFTPDWLHGVRYTDLPG
jgi:hypothetical protein